MCARPCSPSPRRLPSRLHDGRPPADPGSRRPPGAALLVALVAACVLLAPPPARAEPLDFESMRDVGRVVAFEKEPQGVRLRCDDGSQVVVRILSADMIRVRAALGRPLPPLDFSWAIARTDWPAVPWTLQEEPDRLIVATSTLRTVIDRSPLRIRFVDVATGRVIQEDGLPMRHDPKTGRIAAIKRLGFEEHFYGLGEKAARLDKRRGAFDMWSTDTPGYTEGRDPLYQSIPFYIGLQMERGPRTREAPGAWRGTAYGVFLDNSHRSHFDMGLSTNEYVVFGADGGELDYYFIRGPRMRDVVSRYVDLTGHIPMPPRWALGHQTSRWSYYPAATVEAIVRRYREEEIPLDAIHLDIHYMDGYRLFTWDRSRFPDPAALVKRLGALGAHVVAIVDPGVKHEPGGHYAVYNEGAAKGYFLKRKDGRTWVGRVWPGDAVFLDYTLEAASRWWGDLHRALLDAGVAGIWNDMNEPADFVDQTGRSTADVISHDRGRNTTQDRNRNLFALHMARATFEGLLRLRPDQRPYVITRAGFAGIQRYSTMWTGDNVSSWEALSLSIPMLATVGLSGEAFAGADIGGFQGRCSAELLTRWYQVAFLSPFCRVHKAIDGNDQEPWRFGEPYVDIIRGCLNARYRLMPYLYTALEEAHRTGMPMFRPLILAYQDDFNCVGLDDEFMVGGDLLVAPVLAPSQTSRTVYLPRGRWYDYWTQQPFEGGRRYTVAAPLERVPLFIRGGAILPVGPAMRFVGEKPVTRLTLEIWPDGQGRAAGRLYDDDGSSNAYRQGVCRRLVVDAAPRNGAGGTVVSIHAATGPYKVAGRTFDLRLRGDPAGRALGARVADDGQAHEVRLSPEEGRR